METKRTALLILDQSKAYDVIDHKILLSKLQLLGFTNQATRLMSSFLTNQKQFVQVQGNRSDTLLSGQNSVIQGSTLSCSLYLIYILDAPQIFHDQVHSPLDYRQCANPSLKTFVDDMYTLVTKTGNRTLQQEVELSMT